MLVCSPRYIKRIKINTHEVCAVLVGAGQAALGTEWVTISWAEVGDLDDDAVASVGDGVAGAVGLDDQLPAGSASWSGTSALYACQEAILPMNPRRDAYWSDTELVLRDGGRVTGRGVEAAGGGSDVAVARVVDITAAVLCERGLVGWAAARSFGRRGCLG